jgi:antitoxin component YwqK of YwqJK toxin-antitoxin module
MQINQRNKNREKHGPWIVYWFSGNLMYKGTYEDGERVGLWKWYYDNVENETRFYAR